MLHGPRGVVAGFSLSNAYGINDAGQVAGDSYLANNTSYRTVLWGANGTAQTLGMTPSDDASANGVNNRLTVAGNVFPFGAYPSRAAQWRNGGLEVLTPFSASQAGGRAINDNGVVVGFFGSYGAVWRPGVAGFQQLASLGSQ